MSMTLRISAGLLVVVAAGLALTYEYPPILSVQRGYRGLAMVELYTPRAIATKAAQNKLPDAIDPETPAGQPASASYTNLKVLGDVDANEFIRLMTAITAWVAPEEGCTYCHTDDLAADTLYTKVVARRMLQMTRQINAKWQTHVATTGVTCYTCHRGQPVPSAVWFADATALTASAFAGNRAGQNAPAPEVAYASLPNDVFTPFLDQPNEIRVVSNTALPEGSRRSIKQTEWTYGLMMHFSQSLGVNCTYCHNSRSFTDWDQSTPQRGTAWYGIRMVRDLNSHFLEPLQGQFPPNRLGPLGDVPKLNCATCHQGVYKPLFGASMVKDYPELTGPAPAQ
jgi:photosynthetic reaction center cytochrome c subunit